MNNNSEARGARTEELNTVLRHSPPLTPHPSHGFTLLELVITIVVMSIGITSFLVLMNSTTVNSVDPVVRQQANAIAQSYLEEVLLNPFCDPDLSTDCPAFCTGNNICSTCGGSASPAPPETRPVYDDVCDYNGLSDTGARNQFDAAIASLTDYNVTVTVDDSGVTVSGLDSNNGEVIRVDVNVTHSSYPDLDLTLSAYRTNF